MKKQLDNISARSRVFLAIKRVEQDNAFTDLVLTEIFNHQSIPQNDRAFISELFRGIIRWKKRLELMTNQLLSRPDGVPVGVKWIIWIGLYQLTHMTRIPEFAAVNESVKLAQEYNFDKWTPVINGVLRNFIRHPEKIIFTDEKKDPVAFISETKSFPEWLISRWIKEFGISVTKELCDAYNQTPVLSVRPNLKKITIADFEDLLNDQLYVFEKSMVANFYRLLDYDVAHYLKLLKDGMLTVQDESAGLVSLLAMPVKDSSIVDLCAAPGGKSLHLAELDNDQHLIVAGDIHFSRINLLKKSIRRLGYNSIKPIVADAMHFPVKSADIVLLDAPCSGLGVLQKKPDIRWKRTENDITTLSNLQLDLLSQASQLVNNNGFLLYSTCTIEFMENEHVVLQFLKAHPCFKIVPPDKSFIPEELITKDNMVRTWPHKHKMDGSFMVKMKKEC